MRAVVVTLIIALFTAGISFAQSSQQKVHRKKSNYSLKSSSYMMGDYSRMLNDMISGALRMDLSADKKTKVSKLRNEYMYQMSKDENKLRNANAAVTKMMQDPSFDPAKVKEEFGKSDALDKKIFDAYVDALASLRDTIGKENYEELNKAVTRYRASLVQMRKGQQSRSTANIPIKSEPEKTGTPSPAPDSKN
jgi:hypothetical protein